MMNFDAVVTVPGLACSLVDTDQADVSGFEEPVEMNASQSPVIAGADERAAVPTIVSACPQLVMPGVVTSTSPIR